MTNIIATIGPASEANDVLQFFAANKVAIARLNCSHNTVTWHQGTAAKAKELGLKVLVDLPGPKIRLGNLQNSIVCPTGSQIVLESENTELKYPYTNDSGENVLPYQVPLHNFVAVGDNIFIDDGKLHWQVTEIADNFIKVKIIFGGEVKSHKGINTPDTDIKIDFLGKRDIEMLEGLLVDHRPEYVAASFIKTDAEITTLKNKITEILEKADVTDYFPQICAKLEMKQAVEPETLTKIVSVVDLIMIARGDLALESLPAHIMVPIYQDRIAAECQKQNKPFIVATQILESMIACPVPTRAEVSDLYRAININKANFIMLSGESASGSFPTKCVELMSKMIDLSLEK